VPSPYAVTYRVTPLPRCPTPHSVTPTHRLRCVDCCIGWDKLDFTSWIPAPNTACLWNTYLLHNCLTIDVPVTGPRTLLEHTPRNHRYRLPFGCHTLRAAIATSVDGRFNRIPHRWWTVYSRSVHPYVEHAHTLRAPLFLRITRLPLPIC